MANDLELANRFRMVLASFINVCAVAADCENNVGLIGGYCLIIYGGGKTE